MSKSIKKKCDECGADIFMSDKSLSQYVTFNGNKRNMRPFNADGTNKVHQCPKRGYSEWLRCNDCGGKIRFNNEFVRANGSKIKLGENGEHICQLVAQQ